MAIKGSFIFKHPHVKAVFGRKKVVEIGPRNGGFSEILGRSDVLCVKIHLGV